MYYTYSQGIPTLQLWRLLTSLLFLGNFGMGFLVSAYLVYHALVLAEQDLFEKKKLADFIALLTYIYVMMIGFASLVEVYFICDGFIFALIVIWGKLKPFREVRLFFGLSFGCNQ